MKATTTTKQSKNATAPAPTVATSPAAKYTADAERIAGLIGNFDSHGHAAAYTEYCRLLSRAMNEGRVTLPNRVLELYPIIRDINEEIDEIERENRAADEFYKACDEIAAAFATIEKYHEFIPAECFSAVKKSLTSWLDGKQLLRSPEAIIEHAPQMIADQIEKDWFEKLRAKAA